MTGIKDDCKLYQSVYRAALPQSAYPCYGRQDVSADYRQRLEAVHRSRGKTCFECGVEPCPQIPLYRKPTRQKIPLTKFGKGDKTPDPYTPETGESLNAASYEGMVWEMPVILGGLYGMRRSEILGLRWRNVDLENNTFDVTEQLPFKVPPKTKVIEEMAPPKSNGRKLPITELARPFFLKQLAMQEVQKNRQAKDGKALL